MPETKPQPAEEKFEVSVLRAHSMRLFGCRLHVFDAALKLSGHNENNRLTKSQFEKMLDKYKNYKVTN